MTGMPSTLAMLALLVAGTSVAGETSAATGIWNFRVLLDGQPIGVHRFSVSTEGDLRTLVSEADFAVKFLGITVYRYRHQATEQWRGDCLGALSSTTDDDGKLSRVRSAREGDAYRITTATTALSVPGCVMSYAYWNPAIRAQTRLLNAQTGEIDTVRIARVGSGTVEVGGQPIAATRFRVSAEARAVDVWYSAQGDWVGLDATVGGGRTLSYRLP